MAIVEDASAYKGTVALTGSTVAEICVGSGPCGELRYPACEHLLLRLKNCLASASSTARSAKLFSGA